MATSSIPKEMVLSFNTAVVSNSISGAHTIILPAFDGECGIMPGHMDLVLQLQSGNVSVKTLDGKEHTIVIDGGIAKIDAKHVNIFCNSFKAKS